MTQNNSAIQKWDYTIAHEIHSQTSQKHKLRANFCYQSPLCILRCYNLH